MPIPDKPINVSMLPSDSEKEAVLVWLCAQIPYKPIISYTNLTYEVQGVVGTKLYCRRVVGDKGKIFTIDFNKVLIHRSHVKEGNMLLKVNSVI